jgi:hypothetical protein
VISIARFANRAQITVTYAKVIEFLPQFANVLISITKSMTYYAKNVIISVRIAKILQRIVRNASLIE